ncbi:hypothetical protein K8S19_12835 [bacterium]|nr:hypothetical protein [bacterium]
MTFTQARDRLRRHTVRAVRPGIFRTKKLLAWVGSPDKIFPAVHITGSNGKGSVAAMLSSVFCQAGYRIGSFTSPHLHDERERIMLDGRKVSALVFTRAVACLLPALKRLEKEGNPATIFEAWTVLAAIVFQMKQVDLVILEVGLGGRLDATTVWQYKILTILTNVHLEHTEYLGKTHAAICKEKLGITRTQIPLVSGVQDSDLRKIICRTAHRKKIPLFYSGHSSQNTLRIMRCRTGVSGFLLTIGYQKKIFKIKIPLSGIFQVENAAVACLAIKILTCTGYLVSDQDLAKGMSRVVWPGRMEKIHTAPAVFLDGSHNPAAAAAAIHGWMAAKRKIYLVVGIMQDKAVRNMVRSYAKVARKVWTVTPPDERGMSARALATVFQEYDVPAVAAGSLRQALGLAWQEISRQDTILITGSLYILHKARQAVQAM